jgi:6-phosphogluconolactonase
MSVELLKFASDRELASAAAQRWVQLLQTPRPPEQTFSVALSGGRVTKAFFDEFVARAKAQPAMLQPVHFFWADERCVPPEHADSNFLLARQALLEPLGIPAENIHRLRGEADPAFALEEAEAELCRIAELNAHGMPQLDLVFLGLGEDGHVASLFPQHLAEPDGTTAFQFVADSPKPPPRRLTLTYAALNAAREIWVLAAGKGKETALAESLRPDGQTPLARVLRQRRHTVVFTDIASG